MMSPAMLEVFFLPSLNDLSREFGGIFVHCCATADHQYPMFNKVPNLRGINRVFQAAGPRPAIEAFSGRTVLVMGWADERGVCDLLDMALPDTRFLFNVPCSAAGRRKANFTNVCESAVLAAKGCVY